MCDWSFTALQELRVLSVTRKKESFERMQIKVNTMFVLERFPYAVEAADRPKKIFISVVLVRGRWCNFDRR